MGAESSHLHRRQVAVIEMHLLSEALAKLLPCCNVLLHAVCRQPAVGQQRALADVLCGCKMSKDQPIRAMTESYPVTFMCRYSFTQQNSDREAEKV
jgi:hypothetical protein